MIIVKVFVDFNKVVGYICIVFVMLLFIYGKGVKIIIGNDVDIVVVIE